MMLNNGLILPGDLLDSVSPINWEHPLNRGLRGDWSVISAGGLRLRNLATSNENTNGTLINGASWSPGPYEFGAVRFDGSDDRVTLPFTPFAGDHTATVLCRLTGSLAGSPVVFSCSENGGGFDQMFFISAHSSGNWRYQVRSGSADNALTTSTAVVTNVWSFLTAVYTVSGPTLTLYLNGRQIATKTGGALAGISNVAGVLGAYSPTGLSQWPGRVAAALIHARALSAAEAFALYDESIANNPNRWNWRNTSSYFSMTTPAVAVLNTPCPGTPVDSWSGNQTRSYAVTAGDEILVKLSGTVFTADLTATFALPAPQNPVGTSNGSNTTFDCDPVSGAVTYKVFDLGDNLLAQSPDDSLPFVETNDYAGNDVYMVAVDALGQSGDHSATFTITGP
jgi:hypothetical protein